MKLYFVIHFNCTTYFSQLQYVSTMQQQAEIRDKCHGESSHDSILKILKLHASS